MPEGDTIWRTATALRDALLDRPVVAVRPAALGRLVGHRVVAVHPVGKHLYMTFDTGVVLHTHMRMTGAWHLYRRGEPWRRVAHRATAVLDFDEVQAVLFAAPTCELIGLGEVGFGLGPDILAEGFDIAEVAARARRSRRRTIAEVLLDQHVCAGIGNMYRCDALWYEGIDPLAAIDSLSDAAVARVYLRARDLLRRGSVADGFRPHVAVHGRSGRPCRNCGSLIEARSLGRPSRILFWCPRCQSANAVSRREAPIG